MPMSSSIQLPDGLVDRRGRVLPRYRGSSLEGLILIAQAGGGVFTMECRGGKSGTKLRWRESAHNIVTNVGLTYLEGVALLTTTQIALTSWFMGMTATAPTVAAADTMASHGGWTENTSYSQATRPAWSGVAGAAGGSTNSASPSVYSANATSTSGGCFLNSVSTKAGTTGTLFSVVAWTGGDRSLLNGDTLNGTYNQSVADDGV
jgi:hypothetical protein